jgi:AraC-like DNA-binding protein
MSKPLHQYAVPEAFTLLLFEYLDARGHDPVAILDMPRPSKGPDQDRRVDVRRWEQMLIRAGTHLEDRLIGLHLGAMVNARHLGLVGHLLWSCENFGVVLHRLERYQRLIFDAIPMARREGREAIEMAWDISEFRTGPLVGETGFAVMVQFCRSVMQGAADPLSIDFAHPPPPDVRPFEEFFRCPVRFNCPEPIIRVGHDLLRRPLKRADPALEHVLEQHAERLLERLPKEEEIVTSVRKFMADHLREGEPDISSISQAFRCSARTLQRRLKDAGTSFRQELNLVRNALAQSYLRDPALQVTDVAMLLGYSEHSAFTRAFRKHCGMTPQQLRDKALHRQ